MSTYQPDLSSPVADAINELARDHEFRPEQQLASEVTPDQISIPCQRTWLDVETLNPKTSRGDFSACAVHVTQEDGIYPWFMLFCRPKGSTSWRPLMSQGGERRESVRRIPGKLTARRTCVCVGGLGVVPNGGSIEIVMDNGTVYRDTAAGGCCIAFAPLLKSTAVLDAIVVRYLGSDDEILDSESIQ